jgi:hypothetical protein
MFAQVIANIKQLFTCAKTFCKEESLMKFTVKSIFAPLLIALATFLPLTAALPALAGEGEHVAAENSFVRVQIGKAGTASATISKSVLEDYDLKLSARNKSKLDKELPITGGKYVSAFVGNAGNEGDGAW